jgi:hypothetical protein
LLARRACVPYGIRTRVTNVKGRVLLRGVWDFDRGMIHDHCRVTDGPGLVRARRNHRVVSGHAKHRSRDDDFPKHHIAGPKFIRGSLPGRPPERGFAPHPHPHREGRLRWSALADPRMRSNRNEAAVAPCCDLIQSTWTKLSLAGPHGVRKTKPLR